MMTKWWKKEVNEHSNLFPEPVLSPMTLRTSQALSERPAQADEPRSISPLGPVRGAHQPWVCRDLTQGKRWSLGNVPPKRDVSGKNSKGIRVEAAVEMHSSGLAHVGKGEMQ